MLNLHSSSRFEKSQCSGGCRYTDRMKDGYGISKELIERAYEKEIDTIITCDNGISA